MPIQAFVIFKIESLLDCAVFIWLDNTAKYCEAIIENFLHAVF